MGDRPPVRVLLVNSTFPPHTLGGGPRVAGWIVEGLRRLGHPVEVLCARVPGLPEEEKGVHRILAPLGGWETGRSARRIARVLQCLSYGGDERRAGRVMDVFRPDVLLAEAFFNISHAPWTAAAARGIPVAYFPVASYSPENIFRPWGRLERLAFRLLGRRLPTPPDPRGIAALAAPSTHILEDYVRHGVRGRIERVVPLGVPLDRFHPAPGGGRTAAGVFRILWLGRVTPQKGIDDALEAFRILRATRGAGVRLSVVGFAHPEDERRLEAAIRAAGPEGIERLRIPLADEEGLAACYRAHDLYWLTSRIPEALSLTLLEAMACGLPVVSTETGGNRVVIAASGGGVGVPPADPSALAAATEALLGDPARRRSFGEAGAAFVRLHHGLEEMGRALSDLLRAATSAPPIAREGL